MARKNRVERAMDSMFDIPKDRKRLSVIRLCLIMGCTALLFIMVATRFGRVAEAMMQTPLP
jgi:hypothetical protein